MIYDIDEFILRFRIMFGNCPLWFTIVFLLFHSVAAVVCWELEEKGQPGKHSHRFASPLCRELWILIIFAIPFFGCVIYVVSSIVLFNLWKKTAPQGARYCYSMPFQYHQVRIMIIIGSLAKIADHYLAKQPSYPAELHPELIAAFAMYILLVLNEAARTFSGKRVYISLTPQPETQPVYVGTLLERDHFAVSDEAWVRLAEAKAARFAADNYFGQIPRGALYADRTVGNDEVTADGSRFFYKIMPYSNKLMPDVMEVKWDILNGVARMKIIDEEPRGFVEGYVYFAVPRIKQLLVHAGVLLLILAVLFTPIYKEHFFFIFQFFVGLF